MEETHDHPHSDSFPRAAGEEDSFSWTQSHVDSTGACVITLRQRAGQLSHG